MPQTGKVYFEGKVISKSELGTTKTNSAMINFGFTYNVSKKSGESFKWEPVILDGDNRLWAFGDSANIIAAVDSNQKVALDCDLQVRKIGDNDRIGLIVKKVQVFASAVKPAPPKPVESGFDPPAEPSDDGLPF
uniref:B30.2/SPRY domain-containing protein n=1 Tax=viral metagenome TaxID=1070528 RepID=A0A6M3JRN1_9ZZZZ